MSKIDDLIAFCESQCAQRATVWVAYSGGLDSTVLLHILATSKLKSRIKAIHVNHGLSPKAKQWEAHCKLACANYGVEFFSRSVDVSAQAGSIERAARTLRYQIFAELLEPGDLLLSAHHEDDQAETLLFRLVRGAGVSGLRSMQSVRPFSQGRLLRPFLSWSKHDIEQSAKQFQLKWVEDESNKDTQFDRNFLRSRILPLLAERWPQARKKIAQATAWLSESDALLEEYALNDLADCERQVSRDGESISLERFKCFSDVRQKHIIRVWCRSLYSCVPQAAQLAQLDTLIYARDDAKPSLKWGACECRRYRGRLYLVSYFEKTSTSFKKSPAVENSAAPEQGAAAEQNATAEKIFLTAKNAVTNMSWCGLRDLRLSDNSILRCEVEDKSTVQPFAFDVRFRQGGERCRPLQRAHSQTLKKLLQEYQLEPWLRDRVPLIYCGDELIGVGDLFLCDSSVLRNHPTLNFIWRWDDHTGQ